MNPVLESLMREAGYAEPSLAGRAIKLSELIIAECIRECRKVETKMRIAEIESNTIDFARGRKTVRQKTARACVDAIEKRFNDHGIQHKPLG